MTVGAFLLALGATARLVRLINSDDLLDPVRHAVGRRFGYGSNWYLLITCPWCLSVWVAAAVVPLAYWHGHTWWFVVGAALLSVSHLTAVAAVWADRDGED